VDAGIDTLELSGQSQYDTASKNCQTAAAIYIVTLVLSVMCCCKASWDEKHTRQGYAIGNTQDPSPIRH
jgi:hypothetical protein